jgi:hypothetical protein
VNTHLDTVLDFLKGIGLPWVVNDEVLCGFLPRIEIKAGVPHVHPKCPVSNLLHEAGHLACIPAQFRSLVSGDVDASLSTVWGENACYDPDSPLYRALIQCSDPEATAWAWAAGVAVGLPAEVIIKNGEYQRDGCAVRSALGGRAWCGINGLAHAGMCALKEYPKMLRWVQPVL